MAKVVGELRLADSLQRVVYDYILNRLHRIIIGSHLYFNLLTCAAGVLMRMGNRSHWINPPCSPGLARYAGEVNERNCFSAIFSQRAASAVGSSCESSIKALAITAPAEASRGTSGIFFASKSQKVFRLPASEGVSR